MDTNVLMHVLNALPPDGHFIQFNPSRRVPLQIRTRIKGALPYGCHAKLIVPQSVLLEAKGVIAKDPDTYAVAHGVLRDIALAPHRPLWGIFAFEELSINEFDAFLHLHERLVDHKIDRQFWPRLGDAIVLSYGLENGCPVASTEWTDKDEWHRAGIADLFPYLVP